MPAVSSQVLSKPHAVISYVNGVFFLMDNGSFRLSKSGHASPDNRLFSKDVVRFGSEVSDREDLVKEKCILAMVRIYLSSGEEYQERPCSDR